MRSFRTHIRVMLATAAIVLVAAPATATARPPGNVTAERYVPGVTDFPYRPVPAQAANGGGPAVDLEGAGIAGALAAAALALVVAARRRRVTT